jgi:hypothetical protein
MTSNQSDGPDQGSQPQDVVPEMETAEQHSGSDHVSYGANSNLTPAATETPEDAQAAIDIDKQHRHEDS